MSGKQAVQQASIKVLERSANRSSDPATEYRQRLAKLERSAAIDRRRESVVARLKLGDGVLIALLAGGVVFRPGRQGVLSGALLLAVVWLVVLIVLHEKMIRSIALRERIADFYRRGLARLDGSWSALRSTPGGNAKGTRGAKAISAFETGEPFSSVDHPYAEDLDLFGHGSLFHLLCTARTKSGQATLAKWLLFPSPVEARVAEVVARQHAAAELADDLDLRQALATAGEDVRAGVHADGLAAWGESVAVWRSSGIRVLTGVLAAAWIASVVAWATWGTGEAVLLMSLLNYGVSFWLNRRLNASLEGLDQASKELTVLAGLLGLIETGAFKAERLKQLQQALDGAGSETPSAAIARLAKTVNLLDGRHNLLMKTLDLCLFWSIQLSFVAEGWKKRFGPRVRGWLEVVGEFEALEALAGYAYEHPADVWPEFVQGGASLEAEGFAHPLLAEATAIRNDLTLGAASAQDLRLVVISGPNMAGKSTFLRGLGVNVVLAQAGAPVRARRMRLSPLEVGASISVQDSLGSGISRFYAEIRRVKVVSDLADGAVPVLYLLDEVLSGTNSHDRFTGTAWLVKSLIGRGAVGIVTTHDLALTAIPGTMGERGVNCHFEDTIVDGRLSFDYRLSPGVVQTSNALELMRSIGLKVDG